MRGIYKEKRFAFFAGGRLPPYEVKTKNRDISFSHLNKMNPVNGMFFPSTGFCLCRIIINPVNGFCPSAGVIIKNIWLSTDLFCHDNLPVNNHAV